MLKIEECMHYLDSPNFMNPDPGLENIEALMEELGNPQDKLKFVHIAGTNGKGSTAAFAERILRENGYRTGMYTSPYLIRFSEKIQVCGIEISEEEIICFTEVLKKAEEAVQKKKGLYPTVFERVTALALLYFHEKNCDIVVLETGLGGRLDATNIVKNTEVAVITAIGLDHTDILGDTKEKIALEKAGIIKSGCNAVLYEQEPSVMDIVSDVCEEKKVPLTVAAISMGEMEKITGEGQMFSYGSQRGFVTGMLGVYQMHNAITALTVMDCLKRRGWKINQSAVRMGLKKARWTGRLEVCSQNPLFLIDAAHNPQGVAVLAESLETMFPEQKKIFILGVLADKAYEEMIRLIAPQAEGFFVVTPHSTRALPGELLVEKLQKAGLPAKAYASVSDAVEAARQKGREKEDKIVCAFGSLYYIGEVLSCFHKERRD